MQQGLGRWLAKSRRSNAKANRPSGAEFASLPLIFINLMGLRGRFRMASGEGGHFDGE
jgi:hypothetical protein